MSFDGSVPLDPGAEKITRTSSRRRLGTTGRMKDGREFVWCLNGAAALASGVVITSKAIVTGHAANLSISTATGDFDTTAATLPVGSRNIGVTWDTTVHPASEYVDGFMNVETAPGSGTYAIVTDATSATSGADSVVVLDENDPLVTALTATSKLGFFANPHRAVIINPTAALDKPRGVAPEVSGSSIAASVYFWAQTHGPCSVLYSSASAAVVGRDVIAGTTVAGAVQGRAVTTALDSLVDANASAIGTVLGAVPDTTDKIFVDLTIT